MKSKLRDLSHQKIYPPRNKLNPRKSHKSFEYLSYIKGVTESLTRVLKKERHHRHPKATKTLNKSFQLQSHDRRYDSQPDVVYKIPCANSPLGYVGEPGRCFIMRKKEHTRNVKKLRPKALGTSCVLP